jgi:hypothetical protein
MRENMKLVDQSITNKELKEMSTKMFDSLVKAVVDIDKEIMVVDAEMHADQEDYLLQLGSEQKSLWGPAEKKDILTLRKR